MEHLSNITPHCHPPYPPDSQAAAEEERARKKAEEEEAKKVCLGNYPDVPHASRQWQVAKFSSPEDDSIGAFLGLDPLEGAAALLPYKCAVS